MQNNSTVANPTPLPEKPIAAWVGLDWADQKHDLEVRFTDGSQPLKKVIQHKPHVIDEFFLELHQQYPESQIAVVLEQSRGPIIYALMKYGFVKIYPINPAALASYRQALRVSGAKDDPTDAGLQADFGCKHSDRLRALRVDDIPTRKLRFLVEARRDFVDQQTALSNCLRVALKGYYPVALELFATPLNTPMFREFLRRWPGLKELKAAKATTLRSFFYKHNSRAEELIAKRLEIIQAAKALTEDEAICSALHLQARCLVEQLEVLQETIDQYDDVILTTFQGHSRFAIFDALPGAGPALAPRLAAAFGSRPENFPTALDMLCLSGVAPVRRQSGKQEMIQFRWKRPKFLHQTMVEFAKCSLSSCEWARLFFAEKMKEGKTKWEAFRALAFKWLRIIWHCWYHATPYDEVKYLRGLQKKGIKLYESLYKSLPAEAGGASE